MRILHITDLHITVDGGLAPNLWPLVSPDLIGDRFDFIVVSGDLANEAHQKEYEQVLAFLTMLAERHLHPLRQSRERIIVVPGNHDIDWNADVWDKGTDKSPVKVGMASGKIDIAAAMSGRLGDGELRCEFEGADLKSVFKIDRSMYHQRFHTFNAFLGSFYKGCLAPPNFRKFGFEQASEGEHWSAHVFPEERVAFYGINSCANTDKYARAASISKKAVDEIREHAKNHASGCFRIGVWHHGMLSERGDADFVTMGEIELLKTLRLNLGIHGHTHEEELHLWDVLRRHFPVIATGSLGAKKDHRPEGIRNQFSIIDVDPNRLLWTVNEYVPKQGWKQQRQSLYRVPLQVEQGAESASQQSEMDVHTRHVRVDDRGVAETQVRLTKLKLRGAVALASPLPGFTSIEVDPTPVAKRNEEVVHPPAWSKDSHENGRWIIESKTAVQYDVLEWKYWMSNGFALDQADAVHRAPRDLGSGATGQDQDAYLYCLETRANQLELTLTLPKNTILEPHIVVQRPTHPDPYRVAWEPCDEVGERASWTKKPQGTTNELSMMVRHPRVGHRYGFRFRLKSAGGPNELANAEAVQRVLDICRSSNNELRAKLSEHIGEAASKALEVEGNGHWVAHLWSSREKMLLPAFGNFGADEWGLGFRYGEGIAGHAFRTRLATVYESVDDLFAREVPERLKTRVLYKKAEGQLKNYDWIIEVPIFAEEKGEVVGTIGFAGRKDAGGTKLELKLADVAKQTLNRGKVPMAARKQLNRVSQLASHLFWQVAGVQPKLAARNRRG